MSLKNNEKLTYSQAGVDIDAGNRAVELMKEHVKATYRPEVIGDIGGFGGLFALNLLKYKEPVLVSGTDGVGTKLKIAIDMDKHDTVGQDLVAMSVNDILVQGAEPLFFLDYLGVGKLNPEQVAQIVSGVAKACKECNCALIGGETAEMAGFYQNGEYDMAGFAVGIADKSRLITGKDIKDGDVIIGLASSGIHSNGYSLARKICFEVQGLKYDSYIEELSKTIGEELLTPTRLYPRICMPIIEEFNIKGIVHITGGGFYDNIPRVLPENIGVTIDTTTFKTPTIFNLLQQWGNVDWAEMYRTFNMGLGMILVVAKEDAPQVIAKLQAQGEDAKIVGYTHKGKSEVKLTGGVFDV